MSGASSKAKIEANDRRNKLIAAAFFVLMIGIVYYEWQDSGPAPAPAPPVSTASVAVNAPVVKTATAPGTTPGVAKTVGNTAAALDPTLHMQAMLVTEAVNYTGSGRNIFAAPGDVSAMPEIPVAKAPARTGPVGPTPPPASRPPVPQGPPPIDLKFFGMISKPDGTNRRAMLLHGEDTFLATKGDVVQRKYRIVDIGPNSVQVEDLTNNNRQTLPLQATPQ